MRSLKGIVLENPSSKNDLQQAVIKLTDLHNQSKPAAVITRGNRDSSAYGQDRTRKIGMQNRWDRNNRGRGCGGRTQSGRGFNHGAHSGWGSSSYPGQGHGREHAGQVDYVPKELLDKMTPQQRKFMFAGCDKIRADNRQGKVEPNCQVGATSNLHHELPPHPSGTPNQADGPPPSSTHPSPASNHFGQRNICHLTQGSIQSGTHYIGQMTQTEDPDDCTGRYCAEIDTRADTICAGQAFIPITHTGRIVDVGGFHSKLGTLKGIPIACVATAYDSSDGETFILASNEALYFGKQMEHSLFPP